MKHYSSSGRAVCNMIHNHWLILSCGSSNIQSQSKVVQHRHYNLPFITATLLIAAMTTLFAASAPAINVLFMLHFIRFM